MYKGMDFLQSLVTTSPHIAYLILFAGMFIEGETFFLTASVFALEGFLSWYWILPVSFAGVILGDITWYYLGRLSKDTRWGIWLSNKYKNYNQWIRESFTNHYLRLAFISKFIYYVNRLTPLLAGWEKMEFKKFFKVHLIAGAGWLAVMFVLGKFFGLIIEVIGVKVILHRLYWIFAILAIAVIGGEYILKTVFVKKISRAINK